MRPPPVPGGLPSIPDEESDQAPKTNSSHPYRSAASEEPLPSWEQYWQSCRDIAINDTDTFRVYRTGTRGPLVFCLHGGGHSSLSWSFVAERVRESVRLIAYDCRGHGSTVCADEDDFSADRLVQDALALIQKVFDEVCESEPAPAEPPKPLPIKLPPQKGPDIVLVGHSMGGAIAVRTAASGRVPNLKGLVVVDVVEGTALEALPHMRGVVERMPSSFASPHEAVEWAVSSRTLLNRDSARISVPSQLVQRDDRWVWRCDLMKTAGFWDGWFRGLSGLFLQSRCVKLLLLAGQDTLDKELMIAQMQGKFQLKLIRSGHVIEEDRPEQVADALVEFVTRFKMR
ncbi:unnamed protein product [Vitrella brassicaformis CCMP3155]|uniref:Protein phosphatase methylesterase 1 n=2 Tax=Vitrella brassicaformis TaxID=1169539 RepID=A0A0G4H1Q8_VITBC|nr:unnamed protein product [Vitrella brassicaformis CCMP3155]|mmetsp:Transcript_49651/g.124539  ORF Transcript_49651/g.124539 Transcript_49651/m.124539 type:complete len:343 (+) Transcript_49651:107-1135(+)|eukprot:CEM37578.1 unnamed protein product [Vitrella brassicaformis CCMP3155]